MSKKISFKCAVPLSRDKMREFCTKVVELSNGCHGTSIYYLSVWMNSVMLSIVDMDSERRKQWCEVMKRQEQSIESMLNTGELNFEIRNEKEVKSLCVEMAPFERTVIDEKDVIFMKRWPEIEKAFTDSTFFRMRLEEQSAAPATN